MILTLSPTQDDITTALRSFLIEILPVGVEVLLTQENRVPEPKASDYVLMTPLMRPRLSTNVDSYADVVYTGSIAGATLTISAIAQGPIVAGQPVFGPGVVPGTTILTVAPALTILGFVEANVLLVTSVSGGNIYVGMPLYGEGVANGTTVTAFGTGTGQSGSYAVNINQTAAGPNLTGGTITCTVAPGGQTVSSELMAGGGKSVTEAVQMTIQVDCYGPNSADNAQIFSALFRDPFATEFFAASAVDMCPFYADDPKQLAFTDGEQQYENRWSIDAVMQISEVMVGIPQQFATILDAGIINVDATYPPV